MKSRAPYVSVVICTYDRQDLLLDCLRSLSQQTSDCTWEIVLVNNYITPLGEEILREIEEITPLISIHQPQAGLSIARNSGVKVCGGQWVAFLDDDARVPTDYISIITEMARSEDFDCFGGGIRVWWRYGQPRWLDVDYGSKPPLRDDRGIIEEGFNWGSNIVIRKSALIHVGGFPRDIGMAGKHIGYTAENIVQIKLREGGYRIGYDPNLYIDHVVARHKLKMTWHIKAAFATGRDGRRIFPDQYTLRGHLLSIKNAFTQPLKSIQKSILVKGHSGARVVYEFGTRWGLVAGKLWSHVKK